MQFESVKMELPTLVLQEIFSLLKWTERLKCKRVSKKWKFVIEISNPQPLCIYNEKFPQKMKWCFSGQKILHKDTLYQNPEIFRNFNSRIELFKDLLKLCFVRIEMSEFLKDLHLLRNLRVLMIYNYYKINNGYDNHIALNSTSLEKLSFNYCGFRETIIESIDFNTPNLNSLVFWNDENEKFPIKFRFPLTIRHLECIKFDSNMRVLKNLDTLVCQSIICSFTLEDFRSLRRLELFPWREPELEYIRGIVNEKNHLGRDKLEILVCGFNDILVAFKQPDRDLPILPCLNGDFLGQVAERPDNFCWPHSLVNRCGH